MPQYVTALHFRQIDIENDQSRTGQGRVALDSFKKADSLISVRYDMKCERELCRRERLLYQEYVGSIIFHNEHMLARFCRAFVRPGG